MKKALFAACFTAFISLPATANTLYDHHIERTLVELAVEGSSKAQKKIYLLMLDRPETQHRVFNLWSEHENQGLYTKKWSELGLNLLRWTDSQRSFDWKSSVKIVGVNETIYQQDSLIDLDRIQYGSVSYEERQVSNGFSVKDINRPIRPDAVTSLRLLSEGKAPIGPDNKPIEVCKMGGSLSAPFIEISFTQKQKFEEVTDLGFYNCITGRYAHSYWSARLGDFRDRFHDTLPNHSPGSSL